MKTKHLLPAAMTLIFATACELVPAEQPDPDDIPIRIVSSVTKVSGDQFDDNDAVGIYAVNATAITRDSWKPGVLAQSGNHLDNVRFTLSGTEWAADKEYFWKDDKTQAEFYCYYPYMETVKDIECLSYEIPNDQSNAQAYRSAEILWGKTGLITPTEEYVRISTSHRMSQIAISIVPGKGYTEESLRKGLESIKINALKCGAVLNIKDGSLTATGEAKDIVPYDNNGTYVAMIVPQTVTEKALITIEIDGIKRTLTKSIEFTSNSRKKCTLTINKISEGVNISIGEWEDDDTDYGGVLN